MKRGRLWGVGWGLLLACFGLIQAGWKLEPKELPAMGDHPLAEAARPPMVALTFDDGPRRSTTEWLLNELARREVSATFFLLGYRIAGNEDLIQRMAQEGHQIGVHTFDHVILSQLPQEEFDRQVRGTRDLLEKILGGGEFWLRPPYGMLGKTTLEWAGSPIVLWSIDPEDWKDHQVGPIVQHVVEQVQDGDIILLHDLYPASVEAAVQIVDGLLERGYYFGTVEELLQWKGITPEDGAIYWSVP